MRHAIRGDADEFFAAEGDASCFRPDQAGDGAQQRGFACTVGAEDRGGRAGANGHRHRIQGGDQSVLDGEVGDADLNGVSCHV